MAFQQAYKYASIGNKIHYSFGLAKWSSVLWITSSFTSKSYLKFLICSTFLLLQMKDFILPLDPNASTIYNSELTKDVRKKHWCTLEFFLRWAAPVSAALRAHNLSLKVSTLCLIRDLPRKRESGSAAPSQSFLGNKVWGSTWFWKDLWKHRIIKVGKVH